MRFLIIVKATAESEAGAMPEEELIARMAAYNEELARAGALLDGAGLAPSRTGWRIRYEGAERTVVRGPFPETAQLVAGYTLIEARTPEEALDWSRRFPNPRGEGLPAEVEVRPLLTLDDFPPTAALERHRRLAEGG